MLSNNYGGKSSEHFGLFVFLHNKVIKVIKVTVLQQLQYQNVMLSFGSGTFFNGSGSDFFPELDPDRTKSGSGSIKSAL